ncbi:MAG: Peptidoglycan glycosyltransferase [Candidatus Woesebacteria bacterium GW2011_GWC2_45_9]|uniref:Peptidoglycan glycosyltransferase n=1 Tax=Candidatus Woesebacteria bacterium GW2011_GWC2_45_9 TaxID=1618589 RepID=A0A0G1R8B8_9BACT|nr:MAG: Peptidoglycan glycosyltransferase [Candidatus Woesebacteria bacterium GW2011_GWC2_45_9]
MNTRLKIVTLVFLIAFLALTVRLFFWQIIKSKDLSAAARAQYQSGKLLSAPRGNILAKDGTWLAARGEAFQVYAALPDLTDSPKKIAEALAPFFIPDASDRASLLTEIDRLEGLLSKKEIVWVALKEKVPISVKKNIEALKVSGIGFEIQEDRVYPEASSAAHLLGFVGKNEEGGDVGYFGLEGYYNLSLSGKPGFEALEKDAAGVPILLGDSSEITAIGGVDLLTHIDKTVQRLLEKRLLEGMEKYGASGGTGIVMNPKTGAILAMSSYPSYDPETYYDFGNSFFKNPAVSDSFEPGSVFKVLIMAAALDAKAVEPDTKCDICAGPLKVDKYTIETWNKEYRSDSDMVDVIVHSDNVGMAFVGSRLGADKLYDYLDRFGIGSLTGIDLQGEASPRLRERGTWNIVDLATASFGQGVAVTPIQMIKAVSAIANGGRVVRPQVVDKLLGESWEEEIKPEIGERVISEETAKAVTAIMVLAAKEGEAKWTHLKGFSVAGKTGTAQIPIAGHYDEEKTIASFIGFAPSDKPKFIMLVTLREPQTSPWASETAAPLWYSIAKDLFPYFGVQPEN